MTDTITPAAPEAQDADGEQPTAPTDDAQPTEAEQPEDERDTPNREAARYRRQLRDVEAERDTLASQLESARNELLDNILERDPLVQGATGGAARATLRSRDDLFALTGTTHADYYGADGSIDRGKLERAVTQLHAARPELFNRNMPTASALSRVNGAPSASRGNDFTAAFKPNRT